MASKGVLRCLNLMLAWAGGTVAQGLVDAYPLLPENPVVSITQSDVNRWLGIDLSLSQIAEFLESLEFTVQIDGEAVKVTAPSHRLDIGTGVIGKADLMEEIARLYGYDRIPQTRMSDELPPQTGNHELEIEEHLRDILVNLGLQEVITHRMTSAERELRRLSPDTPPVDKPYLSLSNPISTERAVLRQSLLASVLEIVEHNARIRERIAVFEVGSIFLRSEEGELPDELRRLVIAVTGPRALTDWGGADTTPMDFFDLKGIIERLLEGLHLGEATYQSTTHPSFHPGKCARVMVGETQIGVIGELHPRVAENYDLPKTALLAADIDFDAIIPLVPTVYHVSQIPSQPPILEDIALIVDETIPADQVEALIRQTGGHTVTDVRLFDVYRGEQIGPGKKSLAYNLTYQDPVRTLTDKDAARVRNKIVSRLEQTLGAKLRG
jgi:phenylalanyl-tRNA synthetase beta chain